MSRPSQGIIKYFMLLVCISFLAACTSSPTSRGTGEYVEDKTVAAKVKTELAREPATKASQIEVEVFRGTVQLSGFVDSEQSKKLAGEIAQGVEGAQEVVNNIMVKEPRQQ
ncbi:MAG: BON domain-containing protein [Desulfuromonadales bacterium]|jgi:osmotically-inducible protein OsmY